MNTCNACQSQTLLIAHCKADSNNELVDEPARITGAVANDPLENWKLQ
jgi:hypothetical protein